MSTKIHAKKSKLMDGLCALSIFATAVMLYIVFGVQ